MHPSTKASLPASKKPKKPTGRVTLAQLVPHTKRIGQILSKLDQHLFIILSGQLGPFKRRLSGDSKVFTIDDLPRTHMDNKRVRHLARQLTGIAIERAYELQKRLRALRRWNKEVTLLDVLKAPGVAAESLYKKARQILRSWQAVEPCDAWALSRRSLEQVLDGLAGSVEPSWVSA